LTGSPFEAFADLYYACGLRGLSPADVDGLEFWQIAAVLGVHRPAPPPGETDAGLPSGHDPVARRKARNLELSRQRLAASRGDGPPPEARPDLDEAAVAMRFAQAMRGNV
jgi:hypothetical protein